jgi:glycerophosphoryl diester phosphodiesterase
LRDSRGGRGWGSPIVYAHRGASLEEPENTLEAFARALELGADALETDAHMTRDGHVVLSHDPTGERMAGVRRAIREATLAEVETWNVAGRWRERRATMPTLDDALARFPSVLFNVDAKQVEPDMIPALVDCIRRAGAEGRVRIASFSARNLRRARRRGYEGALGLAAFDLTRAMLMPRVLRRRSSFEGDAAQVPLRAWGVTFAKQEAIDRLHECGLRVDFWTVDDPRLAAKLFAMGADGVMTNDPRTVVRQKSS